MAIFTWTPSKNFTKGVKPRLRQLQFGDGYSQRVPEAINNIESEWSLSFNNRSLVDAAAIDAFLADKKGTDAFTWTPEGELNSVSVYCPEWSQQYTSHISRTVKAKFMRVYEVVA